MFPGNKNAITRVLLGMPNKQKRFDVLLNALYADVYRYAFWLCKNKPMAEDLVQETYLRAWKNFQNLKDEKAAKAWLFTIVRRENARQYERFQPELLDASEVSLVDTGISPGDNSEYYLVQQHIANLSIEFREPLILQLIGGFSAGEISLILDVNKNTVLTRLFRARNKLRQLLLGKAVTKGVNNG